MEIWSVETFKTFRTPWRSEPTERWMGANYYYDKQSAEAAAFRETKRLGDPDKVRLIKREGEAAEIWMQRVDDWASD